MKEADQQNKLFHVPQLMSAKSSKDEPSRKKQTPNPLKKDISEWEENTLSFVDSLD